MVTLGTPAWWCKRCESWWPGAWLVTDDEDAVPDEHYNALTERYCAECGTQLVPRVRYVREMPPW